MRIAKRDFQIRPTPSVGALARLAEFVLETARVEADSASFVFVDDVRMIEHHCRYAGKERPTDVLSFLAGDLDPSGERDLGDVVICTDQAARQAVARGVGFMEELQILALHGFLHLLGYDHERDDGEMRTLERALRPLILSAGHRGRVDRATTNSNPAR